MHRLRLGSASAPKIEAVRTVCSAFKMYGELDFREVPSGVSPQPLSSEECFLGARNRATLCQEQGVIGIGIECGIAELSPGSFFLFSACVLVDEQKIFLGSSAGYELNQDIVELLLHEKCDLNHAIARLQYSEDTAIGKGQGAIGLFTKGAYPRAEFVQTAVMMAFFRRHQE